METLNKIAIRKALKENEVIGNFLKKGTPDIGYGIRKLSELTKINETFLAQNIDQIRNWID